MNGVNECIITFFLQSPWPPLRLRTWLWWVRCRLPWSVRQKDDKTSGLTINIHSTITESKAQWLHLVFTVTLHLASSVLRLSSHVHSAHHILLLCVFPTLLPSAVSLHRLISVCFCFFPSFCYFLSSPPEMNMAAERPPDDPQPIMYVQSYPYPNNLLTNRRSHRAPLSKPSSLGGCMLLRGMCSCVIKSERSQTCQAQIASAWFEAKIWRFSRLQFSPWFKFTKIKSCLCPTVLLSFWLNSFLLTYLV